MAPPVGFADMLTRPESTNARVNRATAVRQAGVADGRESGPPRDRRATEHDSVTIAFEVPTGTQPSPLESPALTGRSAPRAPAAAGQHEHAEPAARAITDLYLRARALAQVTVSLTLTAQVIARHALQRAINAELAGETPRFRRSAQDRQASGKRLPQQPHSNVLPVGRDAGLRVV